MIVMDLTPLVDPTRETVKQLFGCPTRVVAGAWVITRAGEPFFLQEIQDALRVVGEAPTAVRNAVLAFADEGMLVRTPDGRRVYFTPTDSKLWHCIAVVGATAGIASPEALGIPVVTA